MHPNKTPFILACLAGPALAAGFGSGQGQYRPLETTPRSHAQGELPAPRSSGNSRWNQLQPLPSPALPGAAAGGYGTPATGWPPAGYAAPGYPPAPTTRPYDVRSPEFSMPVPNPGGFLDNFFGSRRNGTPAYVPPAPPPLPTVPTAPQVPAPAYAPSAQPQARTAPPSQPEPPSTPTPASQWRQPGDGGYPGQAQWSQPGSGQYPGQQNWSPPPGTTSDASSPPAPRPTPARTSARSTPRPYANPQEGGNAFPMREPPQIGRNDPRFRPPELKGTP